MHPPMSSPAISIDGEQYAFVNPAALTAEQLAILAPLVIRCVREAHDLTLTRERLAPLVTRVVRKLPDAVLKRLTLRQQMTIIRQWATLLHEFAQKE